MTRSPQDSPASAALALRLAKYAYSPAGPSTPSRSAPSPVARLPRSAQRVKQKVISDDDDDGDVYRVEEERPLKKNKKKPRPYAAPEVYEHLRPIPDHLIPDLDLVFCGINPGKKSSISGHHFMHPTNKFWRAIHLSGITPRLYSPTEDSLLPVDLNLGLTNLCDRPTSEQSELSTREMRLQVPNLTAKLSENRPKVVCFVGKKIWDVYESVVKKTAVPSYGPPAKRQNGNMKLEVVVGVEAEFDDEVIKVESRDAELAHQDVDLLESEIEETIKLEREPASNPSDIPPTPPTSSAILRRMTPVKANSPLVEDIKPILPATPQRRDRSTPGSTPRRARTVVAKPFEWHQPRSIRLPHTDEAGKITSCTYFWVTPSTSGLERTPMTDLVAIFASLHTFVGELRAGRGEEREWVDIDVQAMERSVELMRQAV
ncbi:hypothetical protein BCR39DRAFT_520948 [Naematelia encephala]|uniref:Uracil-DNA glycosylase-like domain-containing protein n=1 Tax=Naematelia encephala TaxID=71784 RepID=A0A1Y2BE63_9TREE|nr:hypothetical protein BCR39DRAFT_520948 [Naematelia encephala]